MFVVDFWDERNGGLRTVEVKTADERLIPFKLRESGYRVEKIKSYIKKEGDKWKINYNH